MKALVLGAGVVGVTTAYYLVEAGFEVTVLERQGGVARETSFANGGQLSAESAGPWANPQAPGIALRSLGRPDAPFVMRLRPDPKMWAWGLAFLRNCTSARARRNRATARRLGLYSRQALGALCEATGIAFDWRPEGILCVYRDRADFREALREAEGETDGVQVLDPEGCMRVEPALLAAKGKLAGGLFYPRDQSGDTHRFTEELARLCRERGVEFKFGTEVRGLSAGGDAITAVETSRGTYQADVYLLCLGSYSPRVARSTGLRLPIYPVKGYSVTLPTEGYNGAPRVSISDEARKIVISRLGERLRAAGIAELAGYDLGLDPARGQAILKGLLSLFPNGGDANHAEFWAGLRPMTPDGLPILGSSPFRNLFLNTGHGTLGWTLSCGSGRVVADIVEGRTPEVDLTGLTLERF